MSADVHVEVDTPIATVRLDGPERHNVLDVEGWAATAAAFHELSERDDVRCVAVRGTGGRAFSAGSDIRAFAAQRSSPDDVRRYSEEIAAAIVHAAFEEGLMLFGAGRNPSKIRMLLPVNTTDEELEAGFTMLEKALRRVAEERDLLA